MEKSSVDFYINSEFERDPHPHNLDVVVQSPYLSDKVYDLQLQSYSIPYACPIFRENVNNMIEVHFSFQTNNGRYRVVSIGMMFFPSHIRNDFSSTKKIIHDTAVQQFNSFFTFGRRHYVVTEFNEKFVIEICSWRYEPAQSIVYDSQRIALQQLQPLEIRLYEYSTASSRYELISLNPSSNTYWYPYVSNDLSSRYYR